VHRAAQLPGESAAGDGNSGGFFLPFPKGFDSPLSLFFSSRRLLGEPWLRPLTNKKPYIGISSLKSIKRMVYGRVYVALKSAR
jgi:hypothetical protein